MSRINKFFFTVIQSILLIDNTKQSYVRQIKAVVKTVGKTIKMPLFKPINNTLKNTMGMFGRNKNTIKNLACGLQERYVRTRHNFGSYSVKYLEEEGIIKFKNIVSIAAEGGKQLVRFKDKNSIQMRSSAYISGKELISLINMVSKSKPQLALLFVSGGLGKLTKFNLVPSDGDIDLKDPKDIEKVEQHNDQIKQELRETSLDLRNNNHLTKRQEYQLKNKDKISAQRKAYYNKNRKKIGDQRKENYYENKEEILSKDQKEFHEKNKEAISEKYKMNYLVNKNEQLIKSRKYNKKNKARIAEQKRNYYQANKDKIIEKNREYYRNNWEKIEKKRKQYYAKNKIKIAKRVKQYQINKKDKIAERIKGYYAKNKEKIIERSKEYYQNNKERIAEQKIINMLKQNRDN